MPNSRTTNLYPKPTTGVADRQVTTSSSAGDLFGTGGTTVAAGNSSAFNSLTRYIVMDIQDADVRVTFDGSTTPTTDKGHILFAGRSYTFAKEAANNLSIINDGSSNATIHASEFTD
jgi:hypothetical protein